jgi:4-amino-4-deoxy-L-arabinose transferase-like glycosyltransferase
MGEPVPNFVVRWTSRNRVLLLLILGLASFLRLYRLSELPPSLGIDEAMNGCNALENIEKGQLLAFYPENFGREGLFINLQTLSVYLFGNTAFALRLPAALIGILTVWGLYAFGTILFRETVGLWAAFFLAASFWHVNFSRIGLRVIAAPCLLIWSLYLLVRAMRQTKGGRAWLPMMAAAGMVYGLGFYTYISYRITPILILGILAYEYAAARKSTHSARFRNGLICFATAAATAAAPLVLHFWEHPGDFWGRAANLSIFQTATPIATLTSNLLKTVLMFFTSGDQNLYHNLPGRPQLFVPVAICFFCGLLLAVSGVVRARSYRLAFAIALGAMVLAGIPVILTNQGVPHALRTLPMISGVFLIAAAGADYLVRAVQSRVPRRAATFLMAAMVATVAVDAYVTYFIRWGGNPNLPLQFGGKISHVARQILEMPGSVPKYVVVTTGGEMVHRIPVSAAPVMFLTDTYTPQQQLQRHVMYITPNDLGTPPSGVSDAEYCRAVAGSIREGAIFCLLR